MTAFDAKQWSEAFDEDPLAAAHDLSPALRAILQHPRYPELFRIWERQGIHISRAHYYSPIPKLDELPSEIWQHRSDLIGIDMREHEQLELLTQVFPKFLHEFDGIPRSATGVAHQFHLGNGRFDGTDALVLYCMIRQYQPRKIVEVGSGFSSLLAAQAALKNGNTELTCIEPYPAEFLAAGFPGLHSLITAKVQDVGLNLFGELSENDILFIDSSHVVRIGGDVNYLFLDVLPRLNPGVLVHVHDVFLPLEYRRDWVMDELRFWNEQYLLQAFLAFNSQFEVTFANAFIETKYPQQFRATFPRSPWWGGGSFWMRRKLSSKDGQRSKG